MKRLALFMLMFYSFALHAQKNNSFSFQIPFQFIDYYENRSVLGFEIAYHRLFKEHLNIGLGLAYSRELADRNKVLRINALLTSRITAQYYFMPELKRFFFQGELGYSAVDENVNVISSKLSFGSRLNIGLGIGYAIPIKDWRIVIDANTGTYINLLENRAGALFNRFSLGGIYVF